MPLIQAVGVLIIRLWSLSLVSFIPRIVENFSGALFASGGRIERIETLLVALLVGIIGLVAFAFARRIAAPLANFKTVEIESIKLTGDDLAAIGTFLIGFYFLLSYLPAAIVRTVSIAFDLSHSGGLTFGEFVEFALNEWTGVVIGFLLAFRPRQIARMFGRLRSIRPTPRES